MLTKPVNSLSVIRFFFFKGSFGIKRLIHVYTLNVHCFSCFRLGLLAQLLQALFSGSGSGSAEGRGLISDLLEGVLGNNNDDLANTLTESTDSLTDEQK